jgi:Ca2+/H+ antiporter, TMEM165/GDT1 family
LDAVLLSFGVIFLAELGDKSQLMALAFATRYRPVPVLLGLAMASAVLNALSVLVGAALDAALPTAPLAIGAGLLFLGFAVLAVRRGLPDAEAGAAPSRRSTRSVVLVTASAFFLAEIGDKTMLATMALATRHGPLGTWLGATAGMVAVNTIAVTIGNHLGRRLPERLVRYGAAAAFALFGVLLVIEGVRAA